MLYKLFASRVTPVVLVDYETKVDITNTHTHTHTSRSAKNEYESSYPTEIMLHLIFDLIKSTIQEILLLVHRLFYLVIQEK